MKKVYLLILCFLLSFIVDEVAASTMYSSATGNWPQDATWTDITIDGIVYRAPETGGPDTVVISKDHEVTIPQGNTSYTGVLVVYGTLSIDGKLVMGAGSQIILMPGCTLKTSQENGNNSDKIEINGVTIMGDQIDGIDEDGNVLNEGSLTGGGCKVTGGCDPNPLPVNLLYFTATPQPATVKLDWASSKAWDFSHYELERSTDGISFEYLTTIHAEENTNWVVYHSYTDRQPLSGISYYRLKAIDIDGQFEYKGIEVVQFAGAAAVKVYPNPSNRGVLYVQQQKANDGRASVSLKDNSGRTVYAGALESSGKTIDTSSLQPGMYVLTIESPAGIQKKHVIIQ